MANFIGRVIFESSATLPLNDDIRKNMASGLGKFFGNSLGLRPNFTVISLVLSLYVYSVQPVARSIVCGLVGPHVVSTRYTSESTDPYNKKDPISSEQLKNGQC